MSDDTPAWAEALEQRLIAEIGKHVAVLGRLRTVMERRFDGVHDDITVAMFWQRLRAIERRLDGKGEGEG